MNQVAFSRAFALNWEDLGQWSPTAYFGIEWQWPAEVIEPLGVALVARRTPLEKNQALPPLISLRFDGTVELRNTAKAFKGALFLGCAGDLIYSKIDARNGAIGVVPAELPEIAVSSEYPVYRVQAEKASPEYLKLLLKTAPFQNLLHSKKSGASGRKRVQPAEIEKVKVPLPPLWIQNEIVARHRQAQADERVMLKEVEHLEKQLPLEVTKILSDVSEAVLQPRAFALDWEELERWGVAMSWKLKNYSQSFHYPFKTIGEICRVGSGGTPSRSNARFYGGGIPWVKTTEVRNNVILETEETISVSGLESSSAKIYPADSLLVAMYGQGATRGRTAKLGIDASTNQACAVLSDFGPEVEVDFVWFYLMTEYDRLRDLASGNNQPNLNAEMISTYPIPLPPLAVQREIMRRVSAGRETIERLRAQGEQHARRSYAEVEALILGAQKL